MERVKRKEKGCRRRMWGRAYKDNEPRYMFSHILKYGIL